MKRIEEKSRRRKRGFTLIELMLVIVILGILAAVAVNNFTGVRRDTEVTRVKTDINTIATAVRLFELEMGRYPTDEEGIEELTLKTDEHKKQLQKIPLDPWGEPYMYREQSENGLDFPDIWSKGPDKSDGTEDDIGNWDSSASEGGGAESTSNTTSSSRGGGGSTSPSSAGGTSSN